MSRGNEEKSDQFSSELTRELRELTGLGASFFRAAAASSGLTVTDVQVIDLLGSAGPSTAGRLADLTGLTTGAITGMLNRLEEAGLVHRERDPEDGRVVMVRLEENGQETGQKVVPVFESLDRAWARVAADYDEAQRALLVQFLRRCNAQVREEIGRLHEAPSAEGGILSAPLGDLARGRLTVSSPASRLVVQADAAIAELYRARFGGPAPDVKVKGGEVSLRYPRRLWGLGGAERTAEVTLNGTIPWRIAIQGAVADLETNLEGLELAGLEIKGGASTIRVELPRPTTHLVPVRISASASEINIRRPAGAAARVRLKGWASAFVFDQQSFSAVGSDVRLQSAGYVATGPSYDIEVTSSAGSVRIQEFPG
ncbi:MAG TPA: MarR family transcriptional regulator [Anaerolineae bacterium]